MTAPSDPKVCIVGAGAVGGLIGARLAAAGQCRVSAWARGETLAALRQHGWRWRPAPAAGEAPAGAPRSAPLAAASSPEDLGPHDVVVIAVKAPAMHDIARQIEPLLAPHTVVLPAVNGIPWWFGPSLPALADRPLEAADAGGSIGRALPWRQVVGCVVHLSARRAAPGVVEHLAGQGLVIGDPARRGAGPDAARDARLEATARLLRGAGFDVTVSDDIQRDLWFKLWGNLTMNPITALTGVTTDRVLDDPLVRGFCSAAMLEAAAVGQRIGCAIDQSPEDRHAITRKLGRFKTSMLQDVEAGRAIELDAIVAAVREIAQRVGVATPMIDALLGLTRLFASERGLYPRGDARDRPPG